MLFNIVVVDQTVSSAIIQARCTGPDVQRWDRDECAKHQQETSMKIFLRSAAILFAAVFLMSAGIITPRENSCRTVLVWNNLQQEWIADCTGSCTSKKCKLLQAGNPIGGNVPLACGCDDGGDPFSECNGRVYKNAAGDVVLNPAPGCIIPEAPCGLGWICKDVAAPTSDDAAVLIWDPCECAAP